MKDKVLHISADILELTLNRRAHMEEKEIAGGCPFSKEDGGEEAITGY